MRCSVCGDNYCSSHDNTSRTQKARGVITLRNYSWRTPPVQLVQSADQVGYAYRQIARSGMDEKAAVFARPCPVTPRHGFVDSRVVKSEVEALRVFKEAQAADPEAEMMLMRAIKATSNAIWVPGRIVIGPGNDGATAGRKSFSIPLVQPELSNEYSDIARIIRDSGVFEPQVPYIEAVFDNTEVFPRPEVYFTQVRSGPAIKGIGVDFIPSETVVASVVLAEGDLIEWETKAKGFTPGTVVWHPGGSMASHYAVHCSQNGIPIIISHEPKVGETLRPTLTLPPIDMRSVKAGIGAATALQIGRYDMAQSVCALLTGMHNVAAFSAQDGFWLGAAAGLMHRLGTIALLGEARHAGRTRDMFEREEVYNSSVCVPFQSRRRLQRALWMFTNHPWREGFGGKKWAECGDALIVLDTALRDFTKTPRKVNYIALVDALNKAVNQAHNGGWWLNKFTMSDETMDQAAIGDPRVALMAMDVLFRLRSVPQADIETQIAYWQATRELSAPRVEESGAVVENDLVGSILDIPNVVNKTYTVNKTNVFNSSVFNSSVDWTVVPEVTVTLSGPVVKPHVVHAQAKLYGMNDSTIHIQYKLNTTPDGLYLTKDVAVAGIPFQHVLYPASCKNVQGCIRTMPVVPSLADGKPSGSVYYLLNEFTLGDTSYVATTHLTLTSITNDQKTS